MVILVMATCWTLCCIPYSANFLKNHHKKVIFWVVNGPPVDCSGLLFCMVTLLWLHQGEKMKQYFVWFMQSSPLSSPLLSFPGPPFLLPHTWPPHYFRRLFLSSLVRTAKTPAPACGPRLGLNGRHGAGQTWVFFPFPSFTIAFACVCEMGTWKECPRRLSWALSKIKQLSLTSCLLIWNVQRKRVSPVFKNWWHSFLSFYLPEQSIVEAVLGLWLLCLFSKHVLGSSLRQAWC